jgi:hypothetical protein
MRDELQEPEPVVGSQAVPLKRCSSCGYDLTGLPPDQTCPKCGKKLVLRAWLTSGGRVLWQRMLAVWLIAGLALLIRIISQLISGTSSLWTIAACIGILGLLAAAAVAILKRLSRPPARHDVELILSADGLTVRPRRGKSIHAPWSSLGSVAMGRDLGGLRLLTLWPRRGAWIYAPAMSLIIDGAQINSDALRERIERLIAESSGRGGCPAQGISRRSSHLIFA